MIKKKGFDFYDITCDRCGKSLAARLYEKYGPDKVKYDPSFKRDCFYIERLNDIREWISTSNNRIGRFIFGWRYNKQNDTVVCNVCELILTTKKESKE